MDIQRMASNVLAWTKYHKGELCAVGAFVTGAAAVGCAVVESKKARERFILNKENINEIRANKDSETYKSDLAKATLKTVGNAAYDMKFTIGLEVLSGVLTFVGCSSMRKSISNLTVYSAGLASMLALTEEAVRQEFGEDGLKKVKLIRETRPMPVTVNKIDPATGETYKETTIEEFPDTEWLDLKAKGVLETLPPEVRMNFDPTCTVLLDEDSQLFRSCHGDVELINSTLKQTLRNMNHILWMKGRIRLEQMIDELEFMSTDYERFNPVIMDMAGVIDCPYAYDDVTKKKVKVRGFDDNGIVEDRKQYGEFTHKYLSFGEEQDKFIFSHPEYTDKAPFIIDGKWLLELSYDGNINHLQTTTVSWERKRSAFIEDPEMEK